MLVGGVACTALVSWFNAAASTTIAAWDSGNSGAVSEVSQGLAEGRISNGRSI
jgi:hypothetical protein